MNYIRFSKKEGIAFIVLLCIIVPLALLPLLWKNNKKTVKADEDWMHAAAILDSNAAGKERNYYDKSTQYKYHKSVPDYKPGNKIRLFNFDPNTATPDELRALGLREKTISILHNYRTKGGKFRKVDDLQKIYGLRPEEFERLKPFINIESSNSHNASNHPEYQNTYPQTPEKGYKRKVVAIDINAADTMAFQSLYGIGSRLATRIVNFRNKLGGFYSIEQVGETYGIPDSTFQRIKPFLKMSDGTIRKMNINTATYDELNAHPYISSKLAFQIMKYRKENGNFNDLAPLKDLVSLTNDSFEKVVNYLTSK